MCLLLTPLLLPIIIWLAEILTLLKKNTYFLAVFQDSAQREHTICASDCRIKTIPWLICQSMVDIVS